MTDIETVKCKDCGDTQKCPNCGGDGAIFVAEFGTGIECQLCSGSGVCPWCHEDEKK